MMVAYIKPYGILLSRLACSVCNLVVGCFDLDQLHTNRSDF